MCGVRLGRCVPKLLHIYITRAVAIEYCACKDFAIRLCLQGLRDKCAAPSKLAFDPPQRVTTRGKERRRGCDTLSHKASGPQIWPAASDDLVTSTRSCTAGRKSVICIHQSKLVYNSAAQSSCIKQGRSGSHLELEAEVDDGGGHGAHHEGGCLVHEARGRRDHHQPAHRPAAVARIV